MFKARDHHVITEVIINPHPRAEQHYLIWIHFKYSTYQSMPCHSLSLSPSLFFSLPPQLISSFLPSPSPPPFFTQTRWTPPHSLKMEDEHLWPIPNLNTLYHESFSRVAQTLNFLFFFFFKSFLRETMTPIIRKKRFGSSRAVSSSTLEPIVNLRLLFLFVPT